MTDYKRAVVLLSGGLDSATCLAIARREGFECHALSVAYGQRHTAELEAAKHIAATLGAVQHRLAHASLGAFGGSSLTDPAIPIATDTPSSSAIPATYVPARNTVMLSLALAWAEVLDARDIFIGVNAVDYSGYPDCRPAFIRAFENMANLATRSAIEGKRLHIRAPLQNLSKAEIIRTGTNLGIDYGITVTCYQADDQGRACASCDACRLRRKGFDDAGIADPTRYR